MFYSGEEGGKRVLDVNKVVTRLMRVLIKSLSRLSNTLHLRLGEDTDCSQSRQNVRCIAGSLQLTKTDGV